LKNKPGRKFIVIAALAVVIATAAVVVVLKRRETPVAIQKERVERRNLTELVVANGKVQPVVQVKISPEVSGEIIELPVKEGQHVAKGDLLVKIKPDNYLAARNSSEANYQASLANKNTAEANLEKARLEYVRNEELFTHKLISDSAILDCKTTYDVGLAGLAAAIQQVEVAKAALQTAEADLKKTTIYSPLTGTITKLNSELGERVVGTAMMAGTEIMTVSDLTEMETRVDIGEIDVVLIGVGQSAWLEVDAFKDRKFKGVVTEIANSANNSATSTTTSTSTSTDATKFQVKIRFAEKEAFRPGMSVTAEIETRYRTNVLAVPIQSVTTRLPKVLPGAAQTNGATADGSNGGAPRSAENRKPAEAAKPVEVVFLVSGDRVTMAPVKHGISDEHYYEIVDGLKEGEEVVSGGYKAINRELEDGKKVVVAVKPLSAEKDEKK
jgi:HlyD family secretion protein